jgi:hypothetical protein
VIVLPIKNNGNLQNDITNFHTDAYSIVLRRANSDQVTVKDFKDLVDYLEVILNQFRESLL